MLPYLVKPDREGFTSKISPVNGLAISFFNDDFYAALALFITQANELSHDAIGIEASDSLFAQPIDDIAEFSFVDFTGCIVRDDVGNENSCDRLSHL